MACFVTAVRSRWIGVFDGRKTVGLLARSDQVHGILWLEEIDLLGNIFSPP